MSPKLKRFLERGLEYAAEQLETNRVHAVEKAQIEAENNCGRIHNKKYLLFFLILLFT